MESPEMAVCSGMDDAVFHDRLFRMVDLDPGKWRRGRSTGFCSDGVFRASGVECAVVGGVFRTAANWLGGTGDYITLVVNRVICRACMGVFSTGFDVVLAVCGVGGIRRRFEYPYMAVKCLRN